MKTLKISTYQNEDLKNVDLPLSLNLLVWLSVLLVEILRGFDNLTCRQMSNFQKSTKCQNFKNRQNVKISKIDKMSKFQKSTKCQNFKNRRNVEISKVDKTSKFQKSTI
jgi:hypothetical protein